MLRQRPALLSTALLSAILFSAGLSIPTPATASDYLGDFCWQREIGSTLTMGISRVGGGHFLVTGSADTSFPGELTPFIGSASVLGNQIFMVLSFTGDSSERFWGGIARIVLDKDTLDGVVEFVELGHDKSNPDPNEATPVHFPKEPLTSVPCN